MIFFLVGLLAVYAVLMTVMAAKFSALAKNAQARCDRLLDPCGHGGHVWTSALAGNFPTRWNDPSPPSGSRCMYCGLLLSEWVKPAEAVPAP